MNQKSDDLGILIDSGRSKTALILSPLYSARPPVDAIALKHP
jgi:hypothetical protein